MMGNPPPTVPAKILNTSSPWNHQPNRVYFQHKIGINSYLDFHNAMV